MGTLVFPDSRAGYPDGKAWSQVCELGLWERLGWGWGWSWDEAGAGAGSQQGLVGDGFCTKVAMPLGLFA